jgi:hypothetical protein
MLEAAAAAAAAAAFAAAALPSLLPLLLLPAAAAALLLVLQLTPTSQVAHRCRGHRKVVCVFTCVPGVLSMQLMW